MKKKVKRKDKKKKRKIMPKKQSINTTVQREVTHIVQKTIKKKKSTKKKEKKEEIIDKDSKKYRDSYEGQLESLGDIIIEKGLDQLILKKKVSSLKTKDWNIILNSVTVKRYSNYKKIMLYYIQSNVHLPVDIVSLLVNISSEKVCLRIIDLLHSKQLKHVQQQTIKFLNQDYISSWWLDTMRDVNKYKAYISNQKFLDFFPKTMKSIKWLTDYVKRDKINGIHLNGYMFYNLIDNFMPHIDYQTNGPNNVFISTFDLQYGERYGKIKITNRTNLPWVKLCVLFAGFKDKNSWLSWLPLEIFKIIVDFSRGFAYIDENCNKIGLTDEFYYSESNSECCDIESESESDDPIIVHVNRSKHKKMRYRRG